MLFQSADGLKLGNTEAPADHADSAVNGLFISQENRITEAALISAIWGPPRVPQRRRLIKAINERKH